MSIPNRLRDEDINFCLVEKPIEGNSGSGKKPFQKGWQKKGLKWNDKELTDWISNGGNYGVVGGGKKNLIILDFDDKDIQEKIIPQLPKTFTVKTGSGLLHKYYFSDEPKGFRVKDKEENTLVDVQGDSTQVVGPGCKHYSGNNYTLEDNSPIAELSMKEIHKLLDDFNVGRKAMKQKKVVVQPTKNTSQQDFQDELFSSVSFEDLLSEFGVDTSKNPSNCPFHSSKGMKCLGWTDEVANCFNCGDSWNKMSWIKDNKKCNAKEAIEWLAEREGRLDELEQSRKEWKQEKISEEVKEVNKLLGNTQEDYSPNKINWTEEKISWKEMKEPLKTLIAGKNKMFFVAHNNDKVQGKPQLIHSSMKRISLIKKIVHRKKVNDEWTENTSYKFLDEHHDKRTQGKVEEEFALDFWLYRLFHENKEYYLVSEKEFPLQTCEFSGMVIDVGDFTEVTKSMKISSISRLLFVKDFEPVVKTLEPHQIVEFTKSRKISEEDWFNFLGVHPLGTRNKFPYMSNMIRSIHLLSSKQENWPLHLGIVGPAGTKKSAGYIETIAHKFSETPDIVEGGNSRIKFLSPSFKEKPANIGYLAKTERIGFVDELGKMIEFQDRISHEASSNVLGETNFLLDHTRRSVGSGNDNECVVQATGKFIFVTNPVRGRKFLGDHVGMIDPTTMSRIFWWVQDPSEIEFSLSEKSIEEPPRRPRNINTTNTKLKNIRNHTSSTELNINMSWSTRRIETREEFLTLYDTCNSFICNFDDSRAHDLNFMARNMAREPMKGVWAPRGFHHTKLLLDGVIKHRCLFKDYDSSFTAKEEDYNLVEAILLKMVQNWNTNLGIKTDVYSGGGTL